MILAGTLDLIVHRYAPVEIDLAVSGIDLTDAVFHAQVRDTWNGSSILIDLGNAALVGDEGIRLASAIAIDGVDTSLLTMIIDMATMDDLPSASPPDGDLNLVWDLHITPDGGTRQVYYRGTFTVRGGATRE